MLCILEKRIKEYGGQNQSMCYVFCNSYKRFGWVRAQDLKRDKCKSGRQFKFRPFEECMSPEDFLSQFEASVHLSGNGRYYVYYIDKKIPWARLVWRAYNSFEEIEEGMEIDHIDSNPHNNSPLNLRKVTSIQNSLNINSLNKNKLGVSGIRGVTFEKKSGKWRANYRGKRSPRFKNKKDAVEWRLNKEKECLDYQKVNS